MCGRFALCQPAAVVAERFGAEQLAVDFGPRYNIAPSQPAPAILEQGGRVLSFCRWGLIPSWAKDPRIGNRLINARAETLADKPAFRAALRRRRCLIPASGFYEWQGEGSQRRPLYIHLPASPLVGLAGLWEEWRGPDGQTRRSCAIVTIPADEFMAAIHPRMPAILAADREQTWLDPDLQDPAALLGLLEPDPARTMAAHPVSRQVNRPTFDDPVCIQPAA